MTGNVLITGSSRGIGRAIALRLARDGFDIVVHCRSRRAEADAVAAEVVALGRAARVLQFDVTDRATCAELLLKDVEANGTYYGVVCNAGLTHDAAFPAMSGEAWDTVIHSNLDAFYNVLQPLIMPMVRRRAPGHRELRGAGSHRDRDGRRARSARGDPQNDSDAEEWHSRRGGWRGVVPDVTGCIVRHASGHRGQWWALLEGK